jgi:exosome complex component RRP41
MAREEWIVPLTMEAPLYDQPLLDRESYIRHDGRACEELRAVQLSLNPMPPTCVSGSVLFSLGSTVVAASVTAPKLSTARRATTLNDYINCTVALAPMCRDHERLPKGQEEDPGLSQIISQCLSSMVLDSAKQGTFIDLDVSVLSDTGGLESAVLNAASLSLLASGIPVADTVVSCAVLVVFLGTEEVVLILDPSLVELRRAESQGLKHSVLTVAYAVNLQRLAFSRLRGHPLSAPHLQDALALAWDGCHALHERIRHLLSPSSLDD